jgi:hypothetical protein
MDSKVKLSIGSTINARRNNLATQTITTVDEGFGRKASFGEVIQKRTVSKKALERAKSLKEV